MTVHDKKNEAHWQHVYETRAATDASWFQPTATPSLEIIDDLQLSADAAVLDVGAGASTLVDGLLARGYGDITLLDITDAALAVVRARVGARGEVSYALGDVTSFVPARQFALWHDRAVFHFMTTQEQRAGYKRALAAALASGGHAIVATFAPDGPEQCSNLPACAPTRRRRSPRSIEGSSTFSTRVA